MTHDEFASAVRPLLDPARFVPIALDLSTGDRVFIDMPEQAEVRPGWVVITRRSRPTPERYGYDVIERVTPADRLPADPGGISYAEFDAAIRRLLTQDPFRPFVIELRDGRRIDLDQRGETVRAGRYVLIRPAESGPLVRVTYDQIARLAPKADAVPA